MKSVKTVKGNLSIHVSEPSRGKPSLGKALSTDSVSPRASHLSLPWHSKCQVSQVAL